MNKVLQKKKIVFILAALVSGGAERQLIYLIKNLNKKHYDPQIISFSKGVWEDRFLELEIPIKIIENPKSRLIKMFKLIKFLRSEKFEIVHNYGHTANLLGRMASIIAGIPIIIASERNSPAYTKSKIVVFIEKILAFFTDALISNSLHGAKFWVDNKLIDKNKAWTVFNGIESSLLSKVEREDNIIRIITIGDLRNQKNHIFMIESIKLLLLKNNNIHLSIVGDGPLRGRIEKLIKSNSLNKFITMRGYSKNIRNLLLNSDIYIHTALHEGLPNAVMEAMSCGRPIITTDAPGCRETVEVGLNGLLVPVADSEALKKAMETFLENPSCIQEMGNESRKIAENRYDVYSVNASMISAIEVL